MVGPPPSARRFGQFPPYQPSRASSHGPLVRVDHRSVSAVSARPRRSRDKPGDPVSATAAVHAGRLNVVSPWVSDRNRARDIAARCHSCPSRPIGGSIPVRAGSRTCGDVWFRQGLVTGEREPRTPLGLVNQVAKRSTWQPPVDSRSRCLGSRVSVEAASASRVVEASCSGAAIRTSVT